MLVCWRLALNNSAPFFGRGLFRVLSCAASQAGSVFYTKTHEYLRVVAPREGQVGLTKQALDHLGEVVYLDLGVRKVNEAVDQGKALASVESVKAVGELLAPVTGVITKVNTALEANTSETLKVLNEDPEGKGWIMQLRALKDIKADNKHLLTKEKYLQLCQQEKV